MKRLTHECTTTIARGIAVKVLSEVADGLSALGLGYFGGVLRLSAAIIRGVFYYDFR